MITSLPTKEFKQLIKLGYCDWSLGTGEIPNVIDIYYASMWFREVFKLTYFIDIENVCTINIRHVARQLDRDIISLTIGRYETYREAELGCINKMIDIVRRYRNGRDLEQVGEDLLNQKNKKEQNGSNLDCS
jgi:hypothetical protein